MKPKLLRDWIGWQCRLRRDCTWTAQGLTFPAGTLVTVTETAGGSCNLYIKSEPCKCCGVRLIGRASRNDLEPIEKINP